MVPWVILVRNVELQQELARLVEEEDWECNGCYCKP